jgi:hypothetical protein
MGIQRGRSRRRNSTPGVQSASGGREWADEGAGRNRHGFSLRDFRSKK